MSGALVPQGGQAGRHTLLIPRRQGAQQIRHFDGHTVRMTEPAPVNLIKRRFTAGQQPGQMLTHIGVVAAAAGFTAGLGHARNDPPGYDNQAIPHTTGGTSQGHTMA